MKKSKLALLVVENNDYQTEQTVVANTPRKNSRLSFRSYKLSTTR
jgi:hypothetical protein